jgi:hypothetical protein
VILFSIDSFAQKLQYDADRIAYLASGIDDYVNEINQLDSFPKVINERLHFLIKNQTGDFYDKMTFLKGFEVNLTAYFNNYPERLNKNNSLIPHYIFHYVYSDSVVGIRRYELRIGLDNLGQIVFFDFPHNYGFESYRLMPLDNAVQLADSITMVEKYAYDNFGYYLQYDTLRNDLKWEIYYSKTDTLDNSYTISNFLNYEFSTKSHHLLKMDYDTSDLRLPIVEIEEEIIPILKKRK